ncbi:MAG: hypothetical protein JWQ49_817 [Edaphobacter sp.]|nr:hypothetical protein [Edaphobacter sp.]
MLRPDHIRYPWNAKQKRIEPTSSAAPFSSAHCSNALPRRPARCRGFPLGHLLGHFASNIDAPIGFRVFHANAASLLKTGTNQIAIKAVRGRGIVAADGSLATQQVAYGEVLVVKLLAAAPQPARLGSDHQRQELALLRRINQQRQHKDPGVGAAIVQRQRMEVRLFARRP